MNMNLNVSQCCFLLIIIFLFVCLLPASLSIIVYEHTYVDIFLCMYVCMYSAFFISEKKKKIIVTYKIYRKRSSKMYFFFRSFSRSEQQKTQEKNVRAVCIKMLLAPICLAFN